MIMVMLLRNHITTSFKAPADNQKRALPSYGVNTGKDPYQLPLILTALLHVDPISRHVSLSGHDEVVLFE